MAFPHIDTPGAGPLTAADLDRANARKCPPCTGRCSQGRHCPADGDKRAPMTARDLRIALALTLLPWALGVLGYYLLTAN